MKVLILSSGEIKEVSDGYANNYLIPRGLAVKATEKVVKEWQRKQDKKRQMAAAKEKEDEIQFRVIDGKKVKFEREGDKESGKLHRSVTKQDIARQLGVDKKMIQLASPIKQVGEYKVKVKISKWVAKVLVKVTIKKES